MFEKAARMKLRFVTDKGLLSVEDLWDLSLQQLNRLAKALNKSIKESAEDDFLEETSAEDLIVKLQFNLVLHVLEAKKAEKKERLTASTKKAEREKILGILAKKQDDALENLSEEDLKKKLEELT